MIKYVKEFSRNYPLFQMTVISDMKMQRVSNFDKKPYFGRPLWIYEGGPMANGYYGEDDRPKIFKRISDLYGDESTVRQIVNSLHRLLQEIFPYLKKEICVKNLDEFRVLHRLFLDFYYCGSVMWVLPLVESLPKSVKKVALDTRTKVQELSNLRDEVMEYNLNKLFPELGDLVHFISPQSVFSGMSTDKLKEEAERNKKGYIWFDGITYNEPKEVVLPRLNIELENILPKGETKTIAGEIACKGYIKGRVKIVLTNKDIGKVQDSDILVSPMTRPDFLPAMNRAAAFVTDEGGITCHAAIVARELKKPCIIGTKIATQVLKDGDMVEVDADNGIVRIL
jgi:phosphohistidine swiveling domain-containing protein